MSTPTRSRTRRAAASALTLALTGGALLVADPPAGAAPTSVAVTGRVSVSTNGLEVGSNGVDKTVLVDGSGRFVFFTTASDLLDDSLGLTDVDTNAKADVYRRDRLTGVTDRVTFVDEQTQINGISRLCGISRNGRFVGFYGQGTNLPGGSSLQVYVRDVQEQTTWLGSKTNGGAQATGVVDEQPCPISDDGQSVAFVSTAASIVSGDSNAASDVFVHDPDGPTKRVSLDAAGNQLTLGSSFPAMSADGGAIAFHSAAIATSGDNNQSDDVFVRTGGTTKRASTTSAGTNTAGISVRPSISANGRYVAFTSLASDVVVPDDNATYDVYRKDLQTGAVERASLTPTGQQVAEMADEATISGDGRFVSFTSVSKGFYPADAMGYIDVFRRDLDLDKTDLLSRRADSIQPGSGTTTRATLDADGSVAAFASQAPDLVTGDLNGGARDAFVREPALDITPFPSAQALVEQQHEDFLGQPGAIGPNAGKIITNGLHSPDHEIVLAAHSTEWAGKRGPLIRLYWAFFLRVPDQNGMDYWTKKLTNGSKLSQVASQFAASSEFKTKYGSLSNEVFVTKIYQNIFDRDPDPGGLAYWTNKLDTKQKTRGDVMVNFSESSEGKRVLAPQADIVLLHLGMLRVMPSTTKVKLVINGLKGPWIPETQAQALRQSDAYAARVT